METYFINNLPETNQGNIIYTYIGNILPTMEGYFSVNGGRVKWYIHDSRCHLVEKILDLYNQGVREFKIQYDRENTERLLNEIEMFKV